MNTGTQILEETDFMKPLVFTFPEDSHVSGKISETNPDGIEASLEFPAKNVVNLNTKLLNANDQIDIVFIVEHLSNKLPEVPFEITSRIKGVSKVVVATKQAWSTPRYGLLTLIIELTTVLFFSAILICSLIKKISWQTTSIIFLGSILTLVVGYLLSNK